MDVGLGDNQHAASVYAGIHLRQWIARHPSSLRFVILNRDGLRAEGGGGVGAMHRVSYIELPRHSEVALFIETLFHFSHPAKDDW